jgi:rhodanese-related sulfurtransferase
LLFNRLGQSGQLYTDYTQDKLLEASMENPMSVSRSLIVLVVFAFVGGCDTSEVEGVQESPSPLAHDAVLAPPGGGAPEISTAELQKILKDQSAVVLDTRPYREWSVSHIPGALNVAPKPGVPMALYTSDVAEIARLIGEDKSQPLVLYCNGPFCGKSKRVAKELLEAEYTNVSRYQLGAPGWRTLVGVMEIEPDGVQYIFNNDQTAVWIDVRDPQVFAEGSIPSAKNLPHSGVLPGKDVGEVLAAKNDGRLPMEDHNTRIIIFGEDGNQSREVAEAVAREAFHNVTYFSDSYEALSALIDR